MTREEAIERIKSRYDKWALDDKDLEAIQTIIPQLAESEDEKVRKWLINFVEVRLPDAAEFEPEYRAALAYLEKQKNASKAIEAVDRIDKYIDENVANAHDMKDSNPDKKYYRGWDDALAEMSRILQDVYSDKKQEEQRDYNKLYVDIGKSEWFKKSYEGKSLGCDYEQNPAESVSQLTVQCKGVYKICPRCKERMIRDNNVYTSIPPKYGYECPKCGKMEFDTVMYDSPEMEELKSADNVSKEEYVKIVKFEPEEGDIVVNKDGIIAVFESWGHHPDGGSFNDKSYFFALCTLDDDYYNEVDCHPQSNGLRYAKPEEIRKLIPYLLASPNLHWKPSEYQMEFLKRTIDGCDITCRGQGALESLYADLQKLLSHEIH